MTSSRVNNAPRVSSPQRRPRQHVSGKALTSSLIYFKKGPSACATETPPMLKKSVLFIWMEAVLATEVGRGRERDRQTHTTFKVRELAPTAQAPGIDLEKLHS